MWRKIKSTYILQNVFTYVDDSKKLKSIKYNKTIQKICGLSLVDYRRFSGRYIEVESDKIKEYNSYNNNLIFEGIYLNDKWKEGKEYNEERNLIFEGEYLDGRKWNGVEKEYDEDSGKLIFECKLKNGERDGEGKEYDKFNGLLLFEGHYSNDKRNGQGREYKYIPRQESRNDYYSSSYSSSYKQITLFEGEYLNGERKEGKEYNYESKLVYEGGYLNGRKNGKGKLYGDYDYRLKYEGEFLNGKKMEKG